MGSYAQKKNYVPYFRIAINGGYSYRMGKVASDINGEARNYMKQLKSGFNIGADATYYFNYSFGLGIKYDRFQSSRSAVIPVVVEGSNMRTNVMDNISINYIAPTFSVQSFNASRTQYVYINFSVGYLGFHDDGWVYRNKVTLNGATVGVGLGMGYDIRLTRKLFAGGQVDLITGGLKSYTREDGNSRVRVNLEGEHKEDLSHLSFALGLRLDI
ncbi:hypothetical protein DF182_29905 [Chitinophaga flava]|uniref:Outer membrane protein beta-barrel domain-containing protein n=2 Tax=Chitinophaga flava TaxID=2259036 RepID=A0A365XWD6_9BACT|nr:hypothetical protein DF182_29905 [Chitinophaga flava]